jgi:predicted dehydrogenase
MRSRTGTTWRRLFNKSTRMLANWTRLEFFKRMRFFSATGLASILTMMSIGVLTSVGAAESSKPIRLMTLEPAHFHAALIQKVMQPDMADRVDVYAAPGVDLDAHLARIEQFNLRKENPTHWQEVVHTNADPQAQMLAERPGNVVVVSGKNCGKIDRLQTIVNARLNVLADKPWIIEPEDFPKLAATLDTADEKGVIAYDAMTQRFEISCILPRELVNEENVFGKIQSGSADQPAVEMESVHYLLKLVVGVPLLRPAWYFDIQQQGEALADVGTHLVDLVQWTLFPDQAIDYRKDIAVLSATRWPTVITPAQFARVSGEKEFPDYLHYAIRSGNLEYFANNSVTYQLRGNFIRLNINWGFEAAAGSKDSEHAIFRGTKSRIEVRQGRADNFVADVYVIPNQPEFKAEVETALKAKLAALQKTFPGLALKASGDGFQVMIPDQLRIGHEAHFALLTRRFLDYVRDPKSLPAWEKPDMLAKYFVTTEGVKLARQTSVNSRQP